jgi:hypothetical protein
MIRMTLSAMLLRSGLPTLAREPANCLMAIGGNRRDGDNQPVGTSTD